MITETAQNPVTRTRLEGLSTDELIKLADASGIDIPPGLERIFIIEEILETVNAEYKDTPDMEESPHYPETALLPKQYNISFIEVMIRDPLWVFVFWEVKGLDKETHENAKDFKGYFLRVILLDCDVIERKPDSESGGFSINKVIDSFTVSIGLEDNARYLGFAEQTSGRYVIKLGVIRGNQEIVIASSAPFFMPKASKDEIMASMSRNDLVRLSGVQDLTITKNTDRQPRVKR